MSPANRAICRALRAESAAEWCAGVL